MAAALADPVVLAAAAVALAIAGLTLAWLPAVRVEGWAFLLPRVLVGAGLVVAILDGPGLGGLLGLGLVVLAEAAAFQARPDAGMPRPRRVAVLVAAALTPVAAYAGAQGWWQLERVPAGARPAVGLTLGAIGVLATLSIADHERNRLRDRLAAAYPSLWPDDG